MDKGEQPYVLTLAAEFDLREITRYTIEQWGVRQAAYYIGRLERAFGQIAENNIASRPFSDHYPQVRVARCEHHYIFYLLSEGAVPRILAVLHERMDMLARLADRLSPCEEH
jgi:plasmid stabilization system protein ParE